MKEVNSSFAKVLKRTKELEKLVKESTKTKVEIKHVTRELAYLVNNLEKSINKYQAQRKAGKGKHQNQGGNQTCDEGTCIFGKQLGKEYQQIPGTTRLYPKQTSHRVSGGEHPNGNLGKVDWSPGGKKRHRTGEAKGGGENQR
ncbi:hypothetical protein QE152_g41591 [Popillia japonica]|uniref:Uncharacterized protein n=1 Tax=Popillia japonica TaxID=7064 RepID=A0AAW1G9A6_POPJA